MVSSEERSLEIAINSPLIKDSPIEEIKQVLRLVMMKIGLRAQNIPSDIEKSVLIEHIITHFGGNRIEEIKLAFEMAIAGKLQAEVNCYENFSCYYFSTIMNAYRHWSGEAVKHLKSEGEPELKIYKDEENDNLHRQETEACYQRFLNGNASYFPKLLMTEILVKDKLMKPKEDVQTFFHECAKGKRKHLYEKQIDKQEQ